MKHAAINTDTWLRAAVIGSIWASFEIVFGSFFHNLRLPFAGTFLTFFGIVLLTIYSFKWHDKLLFIKAGIICALMRSVSPTAIIVGPLIGIMLEAIIFQVTINIFGRNFIGFAVAGILAMFGAIIHKIISILIIYGWNIVKVAENFYYYLLKISHLSLSLYGLLVTVGVVYVLAGIFSAATGYFTGKKVWQAISGEQLPKLTTGKNLFTINDFHYQPIILILHPVLIVLGLFLLERYTFWYSAVLVILYIVLALLRYGKALRRIAKPVFWLQLLIVLVVTAMFWNGFSKDHWFDAGGIETGIRIVLRALLLIIGFSSMSVELKNPFVKTLLFRTGFSGLYLTSELAVSALPFLIKQIASARFFWHPVKSFMMAIRFSDNLLKEFKKQSLTGIKVFVITDETRSGKTTFLKAILTHLQQKNKKIQGIIAHGIDKNGVRQGFDIENIKTGQKERLCDRTQESGDKHFGRFYFKQAGLSFGEEALSLAPDNLPEYLIIDEIGPMELKGSGWYSAIEKTLKQNRITMIWVVRKKLLEKLINTWPHLDYHIFDISKSTVETVLERLRNLS